MKGRSEVGRRRGTEWYITPRREGRGRGRAARTSADARLHAASPDLVKHQHQLPALRTSRRQSMPISSIPAPRYPSLLSSPTAHSRAPTIAMQAVATQLNSLRAFVAHMHASAWQPFHQPAQIARRNKAPCRAD